MAKKIDELLKLLAENVIDQKDKKVIKTIRMKPEWIKMHDELEELLSEVTALKSKLQAKRDLMWGTISTETGIYENQMTITDDAQAIEVFDIVK
jgi:hypothetical protein